MGLDLGKQVGPLPLGGWIAVVGTGVGMAIFQRRAESGVEAEIVEDVSGVPGVGEGPGWVAVPPPTTGPEAPEIVDNEAWGTAAINFLIASGYNPTAADQAIRKYLNASTLSISERALVNVALQKLGAPPVPLPPGGKLPMIPKPPAKTPRKRRKRKPPPKKRRPRDRKDDDDKRRGHGGARVRYHTVKPGQTLSGLGKRYGTSWQAIFNANRKGRRREDGTPGVIVNPNLIFPGQKLIIP